MPPEFRSVAVHAETHEVARRLAKIERRSIAAVVALALADRAARLKAASAKPETPDHAS